MGQQGDVDMNIQFHELFEIVQQPDHSRGKLLALQKKYKIDSLQFFSLYKEGIDLPISEKDRDNWLFQLEMFISTDGDIFDLVDNMGPIDTPLELIA